MIDEAYKIWVDVHNGLGRVNLLYPNGRVHHFPQSILRLDDAIIQAAHLIITDLDMTEEGQ